MGLLKKGEGSRKATARNPPTIAWTIAAVQNSRLSPSVVLGELLTGDFANRRRLSEHLEPIESVEPDDGFLYPITH
jgi:hypothetical protein